MMRALDKGRFSLGLSVAALTASVGALGIAARQAYPSFFSVSTAEPTISDLDNASAAAEGDWYNEDRFKEIFSKIGEMDRQVQEVRQAAANAEAHARRAQETADAIPR